MTDVVFRGKRVDGKGWAEGRVFIPIYVGNETILFIANHGERANASIDENFNLTHLEVFGCKIKPETFGMGSGLDDKTGKEIFDGDIIRVTYTEYYYTGKVHKYFVALVKYCDGAFIATTNEDYDDIPLGKLSMEDVEIIGNIHDNPELFTDFKRLEENNEHCS